MWVLGAVSVVGWLVLRWCVCFRVCVRVFVSWLVRVSCPGLRFLKPSGYPLIILPPAVYKEYYR